eukprot:TRINITY_DN5156_c0_g1_i1.p1 TRINITY_DN5156_c0_g1~~TRINITY_DN5156_c0_g1_i1.p1  ORF type:complete len:852 (+),score=150.17 TRINITY_DN5156_c0_g1_i1:93-2558(+)
MRKASQVLLLSLSAIILTTRGQGQECPDISPDSTFPCDFQKAVGNCETQEGLRNSEGILVYCLVTCELCDVANLDALPADIVQVDLLEQLRESDGSTAAVTSEVISVESFQTVVENEMTSAVAILTEEEAAGANVTQALIQGATATTEAVANAIATAMSTVSIEGFTTDANAQARGVVEASATAIAEATASAYAVALAEAGDEFTELEAQTITTDIQKALTTAAGEIVITGNTQASFFQNSYSTAVAQAVANATASAFARIFGGESQAIAFAAAQAFNTSQLSCLPTCVTEPPSQDRDCLSYVASDECPSIEGFCECACGTCASGSEATVDTFVTLTTESDVEQFINTAGEAFATGAGDANAVAASFVDAVAAGKAEVVANAVAEAIGAVNIPASALADIIAEATNLGGDEVVSAIAEGLALAEKGGDANSLAQAITYALTTGEAGDAAAMTTALSTAIADGGCQAISQALSQAESLAAEEGTGDAFAAALSESTSVNECLKGSTEDVVDSSSESYVTSTSTSTAEITAESIAKSLQDGAVAAAASAIGQAASEDRSTAIAGAITIANDKGVPAETIMGAIVRAIDEGDDVTIAVVAAAFTSLESTNIEALAKVVVAGFVGSGDAIPAVLAQAVSAEGCASIEKALARAETIATERGNADAFNSALTEPVSACLGTSVSTANAISAAVSSADLSTVATTSESAFAQGEASALVTGMAIAIGNGATCGVVTDALAIAAVEAESAGSGKALFDAVQQAGSVSKCLGAGVQKCRGSVASTCCGAYPEKCGCAGSRCRASKNTERTIAVLNLYVYNDIGNRQCKC